MSFFPGKDPPLGDAHAADAIDLVLVPRSVDLGGISPCAARCRTRERRMVGPFIFFDHFGPAEFRAGQGIDVRPHPHIGLATVTYPVRRRDHAPRQPRHRRRRSARATVNWMTAGHGIVHSERTAPEHRARGRADCTASNAGSRCRPPRRRRAPGFAHHDAAALPLVTGERQDRCAWSPASIYGARSPVETLWETLFADVDARGRARRCRSTRRPRSAALYRRLRRGRDRGRALRAPAGSSSFAPATRITVDGRDRCARAFCSAARRWTARGTSGGTSSPRARSASSRPRPTGSSRRFDTVPGDETEFIPLPEGS